MSKGNGAGTPVRRSWSREQLRTDGRELHMDAALVQPELPALDRELEASAVPVRAAAVFV